MSRKVNQLDPITNAHAKNDSWLIPQCDPITGVSEKMTVSQAKEVYATKSYTYVSDGTEGDTLTITQIQGYMILMIMRESGPIFEKGSAPGPNEFTWDDTDIVLGTPVNDETPGEHFLILYRTY